MRRRSPAPLPLIAPAALAALALLAGCTAAPQPEPEPRAETNVETPRLTGSWTLVSGSDADGEFWPGAIREEEGGDDDELPLVVNGATARGGDCGRYEFRVVRGDDGVHFQARSVTFQGCSPASMYERGERFADALAAADAVLVDDGLSLVLAGPEVELRFARPDAAD